MAPRFRQVLALPPALLNRGVGLRGETEGDVPFLRDLYVAYRWQELGIADWLADSKLAFLSDQFALQHRHYDRFYPHTDFGIITMQDNPIGRLYLDRRPDELRIVDILLAEPYRNQGIGGAFLTSIMAEAAAAAVPIVIHVEKFNPALRLYRKIGFVETEESGPYWRMHWSPQPR